MRRISHPNHARFVTFSTYQRFNLFSKPAIRDVFKQQLALTTERHAFCLYAWVLMPNHAHLLIREPATGDIAPLLFTLKQGCSKRIVNRWRELDAPVLAKLKDNRGRTHFWQRGGGHDRNIYSEHEFNEKVDYMHKNPVRASLVERPIDWDWSSARWWMGQRGEGEIRCQSRIDLPANQ